MTLDTKIDQLTRVGKSTAARLGKLGIRTVADLLRHYPFRYDDFGLILPIAKLAAGTTATVCGKIELIANRRSPRRQMMLTEAVVSDATGTISAVWFNQPYLTRQFKPGDDVYLAGQVTYEFHQLQFVNPSLEPKKSFTLHTARLVPIYPLTEGVTQRQIRFLVQQALPACREFADPLPAELKKRNVFPSLSWSLQHVHFPDNRRSLDAALRRLKFDELFLLQMLVQRARMQLTALPAHAIPFRETESRRFVASLGFSLTADQRKAAWQILQDIAKPVPMNRILEGEVGAGKTVVVALAALNVAFAGGQTAMLAPTEILAEQHYRTFCRLFADWPLSIGLLTRTLRAVQRTPKSKVVVKKIPSKAKMTAAISRGELDVVVGTHAILQERVEWKKLALAVVDEQHRFGVEQRQRLRAAAPHGPHFLSLTATPIPRSLALVFYGDLEISAIRQLPRERKPIVTRVVTPNNRQKMYQFIRAQVAAGRQAFVVCPLIDPSDRLGVRSATAEQQKLQREVFPELVVGVLHGKLSAEKKTAVMEDFLQQRIQVLVSTTVVEVGVDVPNASTMVVEGAERFGLAQLHQLRGRVGRGAHQSYCFLCSDAASGDVYQRLTAFLRAKDGFEIAELDLQYRGPGQLLGLEQSGFSQLKLARMSDLALAREAQAEAISLLRADPALAQHPALAAFVRQEEGREVHLE